tara:strand:- start:38607 stop:39155 length:549 start_codon:yes stop_codon:yes gene_type:complete
MKILILFLTLHFNQINRIDSIKIGNTQTIIIKTEESTKDQESLDLKSILTVIIPSIISLIGFFLISKDVKKQINLSKEQFKKQNRVRFLNEFKKLIVQLLSELDPSNGVNYEHHRNTGFYSEKHQLIHYGLLMLLDSKVSDENELIVELNNLKSENIKLSESLVKISQLGSQIISFRNKELI